MENIISKISREDGTAIELLKDYVQSWERTDVYSEEKKRDLERMYMFFRTNCKPNCPSGIIDIGYCLSDIYDKQSEFEKSLEITKQILFCFELSMSKEELVYDKRYIRKVIGCAYGMVIAEVKSDAQKNDLLKQSKELFIKARELCENYSNSIISLFYDKEFLWWLYYSDYGIYWLIKGNVHKKKQEDREANRAYRSALDQFKYGLEHERILRDAIKDNDERYRDMIDDIKKVFAANKSGMGIALFQLGDYRKSISELKEVLETIDELKDKNRVNHIKEYIVRGVIELWEQNYNDLQYEDFKICKDYLDDLVNDGVKGTDEICNKIKEMEEFFQ